MGENEIWQKLQRDAQRHIREWSNLFSDIGVTEILKSSSYKRVDFQENQVQIRFAPSPRGSK
ncbi:MAG: hypothetical protein UY26_C0002G0081 [Candidatus Jorgensenbacteria bacterium GW2011_GWA1_48_13]|uniref:Uncharacterized protein n=1 Tax=Candidatus Jorgensenbacteria bacterium GW2011_GWB1_50_10 TaxID=1618665 RepID=A0A0G1W9Z2_9BACT|nr:MAG: hypothetical protein UY26_C0002G0081 [Candidatus Jorgensenbacteria bacterium GW2011_GWA1_48_13]KKW15430.1 MAG: hypothetical protein UY55_C0001G0184 [Candidatus Jorgensenbacteria bacterium GW2011_GWB1_50_10]